MVDDALYQASVRSEVRERLDRPSPYDLGEQRGAAEAHLRELITPRITTLWERHFAGSGLRLEVGEAHLAWPRLFTGVFPLTVLAPGEQRTVRKASDTGGRPLAQDSL
jgi:hypothetical protein